MAPNYADGCACAADWLRAAAVAVVALKTESGAFHMKTESGAFHMRGIVM